MDAAQHVVDTIQTADGNAIAVLADVASEVQIEAAILEVEKRFGGLDTVIANAGVMLFGRDTVATELDLETWQQTIDVNLTRMFLTCKPQLRAFLLTVGSPG